MKGIKCEHGDADRYASGRCRPCTYAHQKKEKALALRRLRCNAQTRLKQNERATRPRPKVCECCGRVPKKDVFCVDHCHDTGMFRGWLCSPCNRSIGQLGDNLEGVSKAIKYLETHGALASALSI